MEERLEGSKGDSLVYIQRNSIPGKENPKNRDPGEGVCLAASWNNLFLQMNMTFIGDDEV